MATPTPSGITSRAVGNQWFTVSWDDVAGADYYECQHQDEGHTTRLRKPESALLAIAYGTRRYTKIRNVVGGEPSGWVTVTLNDRGEITGIDGDDTPERPPNPPGELRLVSTDMEYASAVVAWDGPPDADYWEVMLEGVYPRYRKANTSEYTFADLTEGETYGWRVRAVRKTASGELLRSAPTRSDFTFGETPPPPPPPPDQLAPPKNVRAHCITHQSSKIEWDRDPVVHEYEVWIVGQEEAAQVTQDTLVTVTGLKQLTSYTARVVARTRDGQQSEPGSVTFRTGVPEPDPDEDPDVPVAADWPAPELLVWPLENGKVRASWTDPDDGRKPKSKMGYPFWHVSLDQKTWYFTRAREYEFEVSPGGALQVSVYGIWDHTLTGIATKGVAL